MTTSIQQTEVLAKLSPAQKGALTKLIKKNNQLYKQANRRERKVLILKDALNVLKADKLFELRGGSYLVSDETVNINQSSLLTTSDKVCSVCARGALFLSKIRLNNKINIEYSPLYENFKPVDASSQTIPHPSTDGFAEILKDAFTESELSLIEACFEQSSGFLSDEVGTYIYSLPKYLKHPDMLSTIIKDTFPGTPEERFKKIASIIIKANGDVIKPLIKAILP